MTYCMLVRAVRLSAASRAEDGVATDSHCLPEMGHI